MSASKISPSVAVGLLPARTPVHTFRRTLGGWIGGHMPRDTAVGLIQGGCAEVSQDAAWADHFLKLGTPDGDVYLEVDVSAWTAWKHTPATIEDAPAFSAEIPAEVLRTHEIYCAWNQEESELQAMMAQKGHPYAAAYSSQRAFFDTLRYACNSHARWFAYQSEKENAEFWAPELILPDRPGGLEAFGSPSYRFSPDEAIEACLKAGWPDEVGARFSPGQWIVETTQDELRSRIIQEFGTVTSTQDGYLVIRPERDKATEQHARILELLTWSMSDGVLPTRHVDKSEFAPPLALHQKTMAYGGCGTVVETDRHILVPLVPLGRSSQDLIHSIANSLIGYIEKGLPFSECEDWFRKFLTVSTVENLRKQFAAQSM